MTEPIPAYHVPQAVIRAKLARYRVLVNEVVTLQNELLVTGVIKRPSMIHRRDLHGDRRVSRRPRRVNGNGAIDMT